MRRANRRKINILYISHSAELYGAEQCLLLLLSNLDRKRFSPVVVLPKDGPLRQKLAEISVPAEIVPTMRGWLSRKSKVWRFFLMLGIMPFLLSSILRLRKLIDAYDVDLVHTNSLVVIDGALAARLSKVPHVWHAREILIPEASHRFFFGPRAAISIIRHLSDRVIAISEAVAQGFGQEARHSQVKIIYDGAATTTGKSVDSGRGIRSELGIPDEAPLVGEIAQLQAVKGYEDLVMAAAMVRQAIPNVVFIGVGDCSEANLPYKQRIVDLIKQYDLENSFKLVGFRDDIPDVFAALDLVVQPSRYEPFGRVVIEAMAAGKPVVGTLVGGIPEIIEDGMTGLLVPPSSPDALAKAIIKILKDPATSHRMGQAGAQRVDTYFSLRRYKEFEKVYEELLQDRFMNHFEGNVP